jgi:hypothetical protein
MKQCKVCNKVQNLDQFHKNNTYKDGHVNTCKVCTSEHKKSLWKENKLSNSKKRSERRKNKLEQYREAERIRRKSYRENNREIVNEKYRNYMKQYRSKNPHFRMQKRISWIIKSSIDSKMSTHAIFNKLGYTIQDLIKHLENQFLDGMSWDNYGEWHIDHIIPQSWLPFTNIEDENLLKCWCLTNLQPLWAKDNISKGNKYAG